MRVIRTAAYQGHAVPKMAGYPKGPFNPEVLAEPVIVTEEPEPPVYNANAQNDYRGERLFRCAYCTEVVPGSEIDAHYCRDDHGA